MKIGKNAAMVTVTEMADLLGITDRAIRKWMKYKGLPFQEMPGVQKLDARAVVAWYVDFRIVEKGTSGTKGQKGGENLPDEPEETYEDALARKTRAEADLKELQLSRERGEVAAIADVERVLTGANKSIQTRVLAMPASLAPQLLGVDDRNRVFHLLDRYCRDLLTNLAGIEAVRDARTARPEDGEE